MRIKRFVPISALLFFMIADFVLLRHVIVRERLVRALRDNDYPLMKTAIYDGANVNLSVGSYPGRYPSHYPIQQALEHHDNAMLKFLLEHGADPFHTQPLEDSFVDRLIGGRIFFSFAQYPVYQATMSGNVEAIKLLVAHGESVDIGDPTMGWSLLCHIQNHDLTDDKLTPLQRKRVIGTMLALGAHSPTP